MTLYISDCWGGRMLKSCILFVIFAEKFPNVSKSWYFEFSLLESPPFLPLTGTMAEIFACNNCISSWCGGDNGLVGSVDSMKYFLISILHCFFLLFWLFFSISLVSISSFLLSLIFSSSKLMLFYLRNEASEVNFIFFLPRICLKLTFSFTKLTLYFPEFYLYVWL